MRCFLCFLYLPLIFLFAIPSQSFSKSLPVFNKIEGQVYDLNRVPVADVYVELLNDVNTLLSKTRTSSAGRFSFSGMSGGRYSIRVLPLGKNLMEQTQDVQIVNIRPTSSDVVFVEFYLNPDKRNRGNLNESTPEVIFVQDVPKNARELYEAGVASIGNKQDAGIVQIEDAIKIFPDYFDALNFLGKEYNSRKEYEKAYPYLVRASELNTRSYSTFYSMSYALYQLKKFPEALDAVKTANVLNSSSYEIQLLYGILLKISGNLKESEKVLLKAKSLVKKPNAEIHWQLALLYNKMNRNQEAADELEIYLKISPDSPDKKSVRELILKLRNSKETKKS